MLYTANQLCVVPQTWSGVCPLLRWRASVFTAEGVLCPGVLLPVRAAQCATVNAPDHRPHAQSGVHQSLVFLVSICERLNNIDGDGDAYLPNSYMLNVMHLQF